MSGAATLRGGEAFDRLAAVDDLLKPGTAGPIDRLRANRRSALMGRARCSGVLAGSKISRAGLDGFL